MRHPFLSCCMVLLLWLAPQRAWSRETEVLGRGEFPNQENYRNFPGIMRLINHQSRVYQRWRDGHEDFHYLSDAATLNAVLLRFAVIEAKEHLVVLVPGPREVLTLKNKSIEVNWSMHLVGGAARKAAIAKGQEAPAPVLTIYVGDEIELDALKIPNSLTVVSEDELKQREAQAVARAKKPASRPSAKSTPAAPSAPAANSAPPRAQSKSPAKAEKSKPIEQAKSEVAAPDDGASEERRKQRIAIQEYIDARRKR